MRLNELAKTIRTVGDENRLNILCVIFDKNKKCVTEIAKALRISIAVTSHHLKVMEKEGILTSTRTGKKICYELSNNNFVSDFKKLICKYK